MGQKKKGVAGGKRLRGWELGKHRSRMKLPRAATIILLPSACSDVLLGRACSDGEQTGGRQREKIRMMSSTGGQDQSFNGKVSIFDGDMYEYISPPM